MNKDILDNPDYASDAAFDTLMSSVSRVYSLRPGHTLTDDDFQAIKHFDKHFREGEESAVDAFHKGYEHGLREGGSADIVEMQKRYDEQFCKHGVDKALRKFAEDRLSETEQHVSDFIRALDRGYLDCKDDSTFIEALRKIAERAGYIKSEPTP